MPQAAQPRQHRLCQRACQKTMCEGLQLLRAALMRAVDRICWKAGVYVQAHGTIFQAAMQDAPSNVFV